MSRASKQRIPLICPHSQILLRSRDFTIDYFHYCDIDLSLIIFSTE